MAEVSIPVISCVKLQLYNCALCEQISENTVKLQVWKLKYTNPSYSTDRSGLWRWHFNRESHEAVIYFSLHKHLNLSSDFFRQHENTGHILSNWDTWIIKVISFISFNSIMERDAS